MLAQPWAGAFAVHALSCRLGVVKPGAAIFEHTLADTRKQALGDWC
jgi:hypothetical protein